MIRFLRSANRGSWVSNSASPRIGFRVVLGEFPKGELMPAAPLPLHAQNVSQTAPEIMPLPATVPFFEGPRPFVRIQAGAVGPVFVSQNHSPSITECPNGDLLAVWFSTIGETDLTTSNAGARLRFGTSEWEPASPFWDAQDVNDHAPKVWWDGERTLYHFVEARQHGDNIFRRSTDNGVTPSAQGKASSQFRTITPRWLSAATTAAAGSHGVAMSAAEKMSAPVTVVRLSRGFMRRLWNSPAVASWPLGACRRNSRSKSFST
jgi:hypothetical protein